MFNSIRSLNQQVKVPESRKALRNVPQYAEIIRDNNLPKDRISLDIKPADMVTYEATGKAMVADSDYQSLRELIAGILEEQGIITRISTGDESVDIRELRPEEARQLISDDGYWGMEQTSDRIVQCAISLFGNNPVKLGEIKANVDRGFQLASAALGGTLPEISIQTFNAVMKKLDTWAESLS